MPFIHTPDHAAWKAAFEHYYWDRMQEAWALIEESGVGEASYLLGSYRLLEAEWITRRQSEIERVNEWMQFELVPEELGQKAADLHALTLDACEDVARRLGWTHSAQTLVSILAAEVDRPWATNPYGYCVDKFPYEKICLPFHLANDPGQYFQAAAHEYAHVVSLNLSLGRAPRWLSEAISVLVERPLDRYALKQFRSGRWTWNEPSELEGMFNVNSEDREGVWMAYQQAGLIGRYLASLGGERNLALLLKEHANEGFWRNMRRILRGTTRTDVALRKVYGFGEHALFSKAKEALRDL